MTAVPRSQEGRRTQGRRMRDRRAHRRVAVVGAAIAACVLAFLVSPPEAMSPGGGGAISPGSAGVASALIGLQDERAAGARAGSIRYVSPRGRDADDGSRARPWRTIGHAARRAGPGTTVRVAAGRYRGPLMLPRSGAPGRRIRFVSSRTWGARIAATSSRSLAVVDVRGDYVDLQGFDVTGSGGDGTVGIDIEGSHSRALGNRVHDLRVPCDAGNNGGSGIGAGAGKVNYRNHDVDVIGNVVHDIGDSSGDCRLVHGIYAGVARVKILNNLVYRPAHDCITSWHAATQLTIAHNTVVECGHAGVTVGSGDSGATQRGNRGTIVANNIVFRGTAGIVESSDGEHPVGPGNRYLNNLIFGAGEDGALAPGRGVRAGAVTSGTVYGDPRFGPRSYRLRKGSPAIDAGTSVASATRDLLRVRRPQGRRPDIGAYEWRPPRPSRP